MKVFYLALKMIWKQKILNLFLIITVIFSISYLSPLLYQTLHYSGTVKTLGNLDMNHAYYIYYNPLYRGTGGSLHDSVEKKACSLDYVMNKAEFFFFDDEKNGFNIMAYNDCLIDKFSPRLEQGVWLDENTNGDCVPAVITKDVKGEIGDRFFTFLSTDGKPLEITCETVGKLKTPGNVIGFSSSADEDYFTTDALISSVESTIIIPFTDIVKELVLSETSLYSSGCIIYVSEETSYQEVLDDFGYAGIVTDLDAGNQRFYEVTKTVNTAMGTYFFLYFMVVILCLLCNSFILILHTKKNYAIYYMLGMPHKTRILIESVRVLLMVLFCSGLSYLYLIRSGMLALFFNNISNWIVLVGVILYISFIFIPISVSFIIHTNKIDIIGSIREQNQ